MTARRPRVIALLLAGGVCLAAGGSAGAQTVSATDFGIAIGGNVTGSTVTIGIPPEAVNDLVLERTRPLEELTAQQRTTIALLQEKLELNERQIRAALEVVGEASIPPERLAAKLVDIASQFASLRDIAATVTGDDAEVAGLKDQAQAAIADGDLAAADALLARVEALQAEALRDQTRQQARTKAQRGEIALARLRYGDAATLFGQAALLLANDPSSRDEYIAYLGQEATALLQDGAEFGNRQAAAEAVDRFRTLVKLNQDSSPYDLALSEVGLAGASYGLFFRSGEVGDLDESIAQYQSAIGRIDRAAAPLKWASLHGQLGIALAARVPFPGRTDAGEAAIVAFRAALAGEALPAGEQATIRIALAQAISASSTDAETRREAVAEIREALAMFPKEQDPIAWGRAESFLAASLFGLGAATNDPVPLEESIAHFRNGLSAISRERFPMEWAILQGSFGIVLSNLGWLNDDIGRLEEASEAYRAALGEFTPEHSPIEWVTAQQNLADTLVELARQTSRATYLEEAVAIYAEALPLQSSLPQMQWLQLEQKLAQARGLLDQARQAAAASD